MNISILTRNLGLSRQMVYELRDKGMPTDNMEVAVAWRKRKSIDPFRSKALRIDGNKGVKYQPIQVNENAYNNEMVCSNTEKRIFETTLTKTISNLYFERVDWLAIALRDARVTVTGEQKMEIQDNLFTTYLEKLIYGRFQIDSFFELPPLSLMILVAQNEKK